VVAKRAGLVGVVYDGDLPPAFGQRLVSWQERKCPIEVPIRLEVQADLFLQRRKNCLYLRIAQVGRGAGDGNDRDGHETPDWLWVLGIRLLALGAGLGRFVAGLVSSQRPTTNDQ
jgi:hypothetical protein